jgi:hypothetical protein
MAGNDDKDPEYLFFGRINHMRKIEFADAHQRHHRERGETGVMRDVSRSERATPEDHRGDRYMP